MMSFTSLILAFVSVNLVASFAFTSTKLMARKASIQMGLDPVLSKMFPRDFKSIPLGTEYGI